MKLRALFLVFLLIASAASAFEETTQTQYSKENMQQKTEQNKEETTVQIEKNSEENENFKGFYPAKYTKVKYKAYTSPKLEQKKTESFAVRNLEKRKNEFQKRKNTELELLQKEYNILNYTP